MNNKKALKSLRDVIYRIRYKTFKDKLNKGHRLKLVFNYIRWYFFYKYFNRKYIVTFQNDYKSIVYPYPDHDAGEANIFTRNVDYYDNQFIRTNLIKGDFIVDAGCNIGNRTWVLADIIGGAMLIDPNPLALFRAKENSDLNKLVKENYYYIQKGVAEVVGEKRFTNLGGASTQNSIIENTESNNKNYTSIEITTIDIELAKVKKMPSFIKIDVEGYDFKALQGAIQTLKSGKVRLVKFENNDKELIPEIAVFFKNFSWEIFTLDSHGKPTIDNQLISIANNIFASPKGVYFK